jgi:tetratricopeptide (TPR) repeat protein
VGTIAVTITARGGGIWHSGRAIRMHEIADVTPLERAREAAAGGEWRHAYELLAQVDARAGVHGPDLVLLATTAYAAGHVDEAIDAWERVHGDAVRGGHAIEAAAAAARVALHLLLDTALLAPIRGWTARAERLLEGHDDTPVHAWLALIHSYERLFSGDVDAAIPWARRAIEVGSRREPAVAALGRVAEARSVIAQGDVVRGVALLNEAAVAAVSGEIDPLSTGIVYCEVVCAFQAIAQYDLAEQWTDAMERWCRGRAVGSIHGRCRLHRAEILRLRGSCEEAEQEALRACEELRPYLRRELGWPLTELGRIRLRKGDLPGAEEALVAAHQAGWDPQPGLALVRLAQGDVSRSGALIQGALDHPVSVPSKELPPNTDLRRAPLLEADVQIAIAAGDLSRAQSAAGELTRIAAAVGSAALTAGATVARGRVQLALADAAGAAQLFKAAAQQWRGVGAPYETALARLLLGCALSAQGDDAQAALEIAAARATFERLGVPPPGMPAAGGPPHGILTTATPRLPGTRVSAPAGSPAAETFSREGEYWSVVFDGRATRLRDAKGLRYLARLLARPGRECHALDLVIEEQQADPVRRPGDVESAHLPHAAGDAGEVLDRRAKEVYRRRLAEIDQDVDEARRSGDADRADQALAERQFLVRELARAVGLGGRDRRVGSAAERARVSVTRAIRQAMARVRTHHPALGEHLERAIRTGTYCVYLPDPRAPVDWRIE